MFSYMGKKKGILIKEEVGFIPQTADKKKTGDDKNSKKGKKSNK